MIKTGIRSPLLGTGCFQSCIEGIVGCLNPSVEKYSETILPLFVAPELDTQKGLFFHQSGVPIKPTPEFNAQTVEAWIAAADALVTKAGITDSQI
jgi:hypothetical protein